MPKNGVYRVTTLHDRNPLAKDAGFSMRGCSIENVRITPSVRPFIGYHGIPKPTYTTTVVVHDGRLMVQGGSGAPVARFLRSTFHALQLSSAQHRSLTLHTALLIAL